MDLSRKICVFVFIMIVSFVLGTITNKGFLFIPYLKLFLIFIIFSVGYTINFHDFSKKIKEYKLLIFKLTCLRLLMTPIIAVLINFMLQMPADYATGLFYLGIVPPAMISIVFSMMFGGDYIINIMATFISMLLAPITIPLVTFFLYHMSPEITVLSSVLNLILILVLPICFGLLGRIIITPTTFIEKICDYIIISSVAVIIFIISSVNNKNLLGGFFHLSLALLLFYTMVFFVGSKVINLLITKQEKIAISARHELCLNDCALSSSLASNYSHGAMLPSALASILQIIIISFLTLLKKFSRRTARHEKIFI